MALTTDGFSWSVSMGDEEIIAMNSHGTSSSPVCTCQVRSAWTVPTVVPEEHNDIDPLYSPFQATTLRLR